MPAAVIGCTKIDWGTQPLGQVPDRTLASQLGVHHSLVYHHRKRLGIAPHGKTKHPIDWDAQPLGLVSDAEIAKRIGCLRTTVAGVRFSKGLPPQDPSRRVKGIDWDSIGLGKRPDAHIARDMGVATPVVRNARCLRGISHFGLPTLDTDWAALPLGLEIDSAIAKLIGTTQQTVSRHRTLLGIPPCKARYLTSEGEPVNYPEALIDLYWHEQGVPHQAQVKIGRYIADWVIHDSIVVEYAGLSSSPTWGSQYCARLDKKISFYEELGWTVQVIWPKDLKNFQPTGQPKNKVSV